MNTPDRYVKVAPLGDRGMQTERVFDAPLERVWAAGDIYKASYSGHYCVDCEEYKDEAEMDADNMCPTHRKPCAFREEENYFFALSKYQERLAALIEGTDFVQPPGRRNEVRRAFECSRLCVCVFVFVCVCVCGA